MRSAFLLTLIFTSASLASGWMSLEVQPGSVLTRTASNEYIAILRETHSTYPTEIHQCTLRLQLEESQAAAIGQLARQGSWMRLTLTKSLNLADRDISHFSRFEEDRSSECLVWGEPYYDHGHWQRDCVEHSRKLETRVSVLSMIDSRQGIASRLECEKLRSVVELTDLDQFYRAIYKSKSHLPFVFRAELD